MGQKRALRPALSGDGRLKAALECGDGPGCMREGRGEMMKCERVGLTVGLARWRNHQAKPGADLGREIAPFGHPPIDKADRSFEARGMPGTMGGRAGRYHPHQLQELGGSQ